MDLLLEDQTTNTTGGQTTTPFTPTLYNQGKGAVIAFGTWDTATATLEFSPDNEATWYTLSTDTTFTADGWSNFEMQGKVSLRASLSSVGAGTTISFGIL